MAPPLAVGEEAVLRPWVQGTRGAAGELPMSPLYRTRCCHRRTAPAGFYCASEPVLYAA